MKKIKINVDQFNNIWRKHSFLISVSLTAIYSSLLIYLLKSSTNIVDSIIYFILFIFGNYSIFSFLARIDLMADIREMDIAIKDFNTKEKIIAFENMLREVEQSKLLYTSLKTKFALKYKTQFVKRELTYLYKLDELENTLPIIGRQIITEHQEQKEIKKVELQKQNNKQQEKIQWHGNQKELIEVFKIFNKERKLSPKQSENLWATISAHFENYDGTPMKNTTLEQTDRRVYKKEGKQKRKLDTFTNTIKESIVKSSK